MKKILFFALCLCCVAALRAVDPVQLPADDGDELIDDTPAVFMSEPVFPADMLVSLWNDTVPVCYQHSDTIPETEYGTCINFNQLEFKPDGEKGIIMTWQARAIYDNGFTPSCIYVYRGTRDLNVIQLTDRKVEWEETVEELDPSYPGSIVNLFSHTQLSFNNRTFNRMRLGDDGAWVRENPDE